MTTVLDDLMRTRLLQEENLSWIEKALVTRIWMETDAPSSSNIFDTLNDLFDHILHQLGHAISSPATHAAQTVWLSLFYWDQIRSKTEQLLWKRGESAYAQDKYMESESWCQACLHPVFEKAGELNKSRIARYVYLIHRRNFIINDWLNAGKSCYVPLHGMITPWPEKPLSGCQILERMKSQPSICCIKLHFIQGTPSLVRCNNLSILQALTYAVSKCLDNVCQKSSKDATLLYACVLEAMTGGEKRQAIFALEKVLKKYDYNTPAGVHLPALLRYEVLSIAQIQLSWVCLGVLWDFW